MRKYITIFYILTKKIIFFLYKIMNSFIFFFPILILGIILIFKNFRKIKKSRQIIIQDAGGFAHQVMLHDLLRIENKLINKILIQFFEYGRYNQYLTEIFPTQTIKISTGLRLQKFSIGEYEGGYNFARNIITTLIKLFFSSNSKIYSIQGFYKIIEQKYYPNKYISKTSLRDKITACWYYLSSKSKPFALKKEIIAKFISQELLKLIKNKKIAVIYLRNRQTTHPETKIRNMSIYNYKKTVGFLIKKNYFVFFVGDFNLNELKFFSKNSFKKTVYSYNDFIDDKQLFELYIILKANIFIGNNGGGKTIAHYKKKILVNYFPLNYKPIYSKVLYKQIYKGENKIEGKKNLKKFQFKFYINKPYSVKENTEKQIYNFVSNNLKSCFNYNKDNLT